MECGFPVLTIRVPDVPVAFVDWIRTWLEAGEEETLNVVFALAWSIWNRRNKQVFH